MIDIETMAVSILCIILIVLGGMTMSQGFLTSADTAALGVEEISVSNGEIMRTENSDYLEIDYYGNSAGWEPFDTCYLKLRVDDSGLAQSDQTRIEA